MEVMKENLVEKSYIAGISNVDNNKPKTLKEYIEKFKNLTSSELKEEKETFNFNEWNKRNKINYYKRISKKEIDFLELTFEKSIILSNKENEYKKSFLKFCKNFEEISRLGLGIYMRGNSGTGKSYYSTAIYNELSNDYCIYKTTLSLILDRIKITFDKNNNVYNETEENIFNDIKRCDLLILDDLGSEYITEKWGKSIMFKLFDLLIENKISFIINTNLSDNQMLEYTKMLGSNKIFDRILGVCKPYKFDWESRRKEKNIKYFEELF